MNAMRRCGGFPFAVSPDASGMQNARALQGALDRGGLVEVHCPGIYDISGTLLIGSNTHLRFAAGVVLRKTADDDGRPWRHLLLNRGALHRTTDENVSVTGLTLMVNGMDGVAYDNRAHGSMPRSNGARTAAPTAETSRRRCPRG